MEFLEAFARIADKSSLPRFTNVKTAFVLFKLIFIDI